MVTYRWSFMRIKPRGPFLEKIRTHLHFGRESIACNFLFILLCSFMLSVKVLCILWKVYTYSKDRHQTMPQMVTYQGVKQWKILKTSSKKVVLVAYERWSFTRGSDTRLLGKFGCFRKVVICGRWLLLWEVVAYEGSFNDMSFSIQCFIFGQG